MSEEREAIVEDQLRNNPEEALIDALYELVQRKNTALRALWKKYKSAKADAWDEALEYALTGTWTPAYNPYREQEEA